MCPMKKFYRILIVVLVSRDIFITYNIWKVIHVKGLIYSSYVIIIFVIYMYENSYYTLM